MNFQVLLDWVLARMAEPTTWRGLIYVLSACGVALSPQNASAILAGGMGLAGFLAVVTKDPKNIGAEISAAINDVVIPVADALAGKSPDEKIN